MITGTGSELVNAVIEYLKWLGFEDVVNADEDEGREYNEEDIRITIPDGLFILEVKGIHHNSTDDECARVGKYQIRWMQDMGTTNVKALYVVNHQRNVEPLKRDNPPFNDVQKSDALWHVQRDIEYVAQTAAKEQDAYTLAGMLLLQHQIERMRVQETDGSVLIEDFLKLGEGKLAKQQIQDEGEIYVKKEDALQLARLFYKYNDQQEATFLYESSKPEALQSLPEGHYYRREQILKDHVDEVIEWVRTAVYWRWPATANTIYA